jgi:L-ribulose-5-phosphate 4-epimerase
MKLRELRAHVLEANLEIARLGLAELTWGNTSGIDRESGIVAIKPSGVPYADLDAASMVLVDLDGTVVDGHLRPSSDTSTHLVLYRAFEHIGGITHTHSRSATAFAQAAREIPCLGTTHADHFHGPVPVTRAMTAQETAASYEHNTGDVIVERFAQLDPVAVPGVLVAHHGPFAWGADAHASVRNALVLETVATIALQTLALAPAAGPAPEHLIDRHHQRKHGPMAYYGNPGA